MTRLKKFGMNLKGDIARKEVGSFANLEDPDGNEIYLCEKTGSAIQETTLAEVLA